MRRNLPELFLCCSKRMTALRISCAQSWYADFIRNIQKMKFVTRICLFKDNLVRRMALA